MNRLTCFAMLFSIKVLLVGCAAMMADPKHLATAPVVRVYELPGIEVNTVAGHDYLRVLQDAIDRQDRERMLSAGFTPEQADKLLDPNQSVAFLAPYWEAARGRYSAVMEGDVCRVWIAGLAYMSRPQRPADMCAEL